MKYILFFALALTTTITVNAQGPVASPDLKDTTFTIVEVESEFPGGLAAWQAFLQKNLYYPKKAVRNNIEGTVILQFIVNKNGSIEDVQAISGPEVLREAALKAFKSTPKWLPATQDGKKVKSYKKQPINFRLQ